MHRIATHYLPLYSPEAERFPASTRSGWFFAFPDRFPVPAAATATGKEAFVKAAWDVFGRMVSEVRLLADLYETARSSIALPIPPDAPDIAMFRLVIAEARRLTQQRDSIERLAEELMGGHADFRRLQQIPGIGPINAMAILAEADDLRRFGQHRQFLKFCGLDLATHQAGQFRGRTKLSMRGNARLRRTLWMAAQVATRQRENGFRAKFERTIARNRHDPDLQRRASTAVTAKMVRVVHLVVRAGADYRPFVERSVPGGGTPLNGAARRLGDFVDNARVLHLGRRLVFRTVRAAAAPSTR